MIAPLIFFGASTIASLIMQYVVIPVIAHFIDLKQKGREWVIGWYAILFVVYLFVALVWGSIIPAIEATKERARRAQIVREVSEDVDRHLKFNANGEVISQE